MNCPKIINTSGLIPTHIHTHTHTLTHARTCMHAHVHMHVHTHMLEHVTTKKRRFQTHSPRIGPCHKTLQATFSSTCMTGEHTNSTSGTYVLCGIAISRGGATSAPGPPCFHRLCTVDYGTTSLPQPHSHGHCRYSVTGTHCVAQCTHTCSVCLQRWSVGQPQS